MIDGSVLYLYSSNIRPLYEQDILDLLAAPEGFVYRFRYHGSKYLAPPVAEKWSALEGRPVLVHFALQQEAEYHPPAFIPVRRGIVARTAAEGEIRIIKFALTDYVSLKKPDGKVPGASAAKSPVRSENPAGRVVRAYYEWLRLKDVPRPYLYWAGFGPDPGGDPSASLDDERDPMILFDQTARYLSRTRSFREARFYRIVGVCRLERGDTPVEALNLENGKLLLEGGRTYGLKIAHSQPADIVQRQKLRIAGDGDLVRPIGNGEFEISSGYDVKTVPVHVSEPPTSEGRETVLSVEPDVGVTAGRVTLRLRVTRPRSRTAAAVGGSATAALLLGVPTLLPDLSTGVKGLCVFLATVLLATLANWGLKRT